jgi:hypothetical protein
MEYYSETLAAAQDEMSKYTDLMESQSGVLEHYISLMELFGRNFDYESMEVILND